MAIVNTTLGTAGDAGSTAAELINFLEPKMLARAKFDVAPLESLFDTYQITNAKIHQWNRMELLNVAETPTAMEEGVSPDTVAFTINSVTATLEQYGLTGIISELAELTARHPVVQNAVTTLGEHMGRTRAQVEYNIINAATNVVRVADRASDDAVQVSDYLTYEELTDLMTTLLTDGASTWPNGHLRFVGHIQVTNKLLTDADWKTFVTYQAKDQFVNGYIGSMAGVDVLSTNLPSFRLTASTTSGNSSAVRSSFIAGPGWAGVTSLDSADRKMFIDPPGTQGNDPARQRYQMTYKMTFKSVITNEDFGIKYRSSSNDASAVA